MRSARGPVGLSAYDGLSRCRHTNNNSAPASRVEILHNYTILSVAAVDSGRFPRRSTSNIAIIELYRCCFVSISSKLEPPVPFPGAPLPLPSRYMC